MEDVLPKAVQIMRDVLDELKIFSTPLGHEATHVADVLKSSSDESLEHLAKYLVQELWQTTKSGEKLPVGSQSNAAVWKSFHHLRCDPSLHSKWNDFFAVHSGISKFVLNMVLQELLCAMLHSILQIRNVTEKNCNPHVVVELSEHDEEVLRYVSGYIPFALRKRYRRLSSDAAKEYVKFLENLKVEGDQETHADSFLAYTCVWTTLQNRGGLFFVNDECYKLFRSMEIETRKHVSDDLLVAGRSTSIKEKLFNKITENVHVLRKWGELHGDELLNGQELLKTIVHYWVEIRLRAVVKFFLEKKKKETHAHKGEKGLRKKLKGKK